MKTERNLPCSQKVVQTINVTKHPGSPTTPKVGSELETKDVDANLFSQNKTYWKKKTSNYSAGKGAMNIHLPDFIKIGKKPIGSMRNLNLGSLTKKEQTKKLLRKISMNNLGMKERVLKPQQSQLQELISSKLDKVNIPCELMKEHRGLSFTKIQLGNKVAKVDYKDIFDKRQEEKENCEKIRDQMNVRERLLLTSERNFIIRKALMEKKTINSFSKELDKKKKKKMMQKFKKVFKTTLGDEKEEKKPIKLNLFLKSAFKMKQKAQTLRFKYSMKRNKTNSSTTPKTLLSQMELKRGSTSSSKGKFLSAFSKSKQLKTQKSDLKRLYWSNPKFLAFLNEHPTLRSFFENPLTINILKKFTIPHYSQHQVLNRSELTNLIWKTKNYFKCEEKYFNRIHLAFIVGVDMAFKLRLVYKEHGDLMAMLFAQLAKDFENFKILVGKSTYQTMKNQQMEIQKIKNNFQKENEIFEKRIELMRETNQQKKNNEEMIDNERILMKKLIHDLQVKNEEQLRYIQKLENNAKVGNPNKDDNKVQNKFKRIVNKLLPNSQRQKKLSFAMVSSRIIQLKRDSNQAGGFEENKNTQDKSKYFYKRVSTFRKFHKDDSNDDPVSMVTSQNFLKNTTKNMGLVSLEKSDKKKFLIPNCQSQMSIKNINRRSLTNKETQNSIKRLRTRFSYKNSYDKKDSRVKFHYTKNHSRCSFESSNQSAQSRALDKIGPYLISDLDKVSKFYVIPDGGMKHQSVQTMAKMQSKEVQTELSLSQPVFDQIFSNRNTMIEYIKDFLLRQNLSHRQVLKRISDLKEIKKEEEPSESSSVSEDTKHIRMSIQRQHTKMRTLGRFTKMVRHSKSGSNNINKRLSIMITPSHTQKNFEMNEAFQNLNKSGFNYLSSSQIRKPPTSNNFLIHNFSPKNENTSYKKRQVESYNRTPLLTMNSKNSVTLMGSTSNNECLMSVSDFSETKEQKDIKKICKKVLHEYIKDEIEKGKKKTRGNKQLLNLITKYLMNEEIKNEKLIEKKKKFQMIIDILKDVLSAKVVFSKDKRSKSVSLKNKKIKKPVLPRESSKFEDNILIEINQKPMMLDKSLTQVRSCPNLFNLTSLKINFLPKNNKSNIFFNKKFQNLWVSFKNHLNKNINHNIDINYSQSKRG
jgi:hypothetical protein